MHVMLTNDDGIFSRGLEALRRCFAVRHRVTVVAPDRERSAVSHGITLHEPLRAERVSVNGGHESFAVNGTPADCVKLGLTEIVEEVPDLVVSGINPGENVGASVHYSGTVAAAKEAALFGLPAISVSLQGRRALHLGEAGRFAAALGELVFEKGLPFGTFLNVNLPDLPLSELAGVRVSRQGIGRLVEAFEKRIDPRNRSYYWFGPDPQDFGTDVDVDGAALGGRFVSITPITCDSTDYRTMEALKGWDIPLLRLPEPAGNGPRRQGSEGS
jgi:5'-nucleotidase